MEPVRDRENTPLPPVVGKKVRKEEEAVDEVARKKLAEEPLLLLGRQDLLDRVDPLPPTPLKARGKSAHELEGGGEDEPRKKRGEGSEESSAEIPEWDERPSLLEQTAFEEARELGLKDPERLLQSLNKFHIIRQDYLVMLLNLLVEKASAPLASELAQRIPTFGIDPKTKQAELLALAKSLAKKSPLSLAMNIHRFGIDPNTEQQILKGIAKIRAEEDPARLISQEFQVLGIDLIGQRDFVLRLMFKLAPQFPKLVMKNLESFGVSRETDREVLIELAEVVAAADPQAFIECFKDFRIRENSTVEERSRLVKIVAKIVSSSAFLKQINTVSASGRANVSVLEFVKQLAAQYTRKVRKKISLMGINDSEHLFEIAKIVAAQYNSEVSLDIQNFGITNPEHLFEIAKIAAAQSGWSVSKFIQNFGITNPEHLFEIAKIAAAQSGWGVSKFIQNYGITNPEHLFEIAKIAAARSGWDVSEYIQNYGITNLEHLFVIAKMAVTQADGRGRSVSEFIQNYGLTNQEHLFEIAKIAAAKPHESISKFIHNYGITNTEYLFEIAKIAAAQNGKDVSKFIQNYGITNPEHLFEIAKIAAAHDDCGVSEFIQNYGITNPEHLFEIAKIEAAQNGKDVSEFIQNYGITNPEHLFEIAKIAAAQSGWGVSEYIQNYGITHPEQLFEIAKIAATQSGYGVSEYIQNFGITNPEHLFEIAKIAAAEDGWNVSKYIQNYGITNPEHLFEIAKIAAGEDGYGVSEFIQNYGITHPEHLFEIAKIAAAQNGAATSNLIRNFRINNPEHLFEIAKIAAAQNGMGVSRKISNYFPLTEEAKMEILGLAVRQSREAIQYISKYNFKADATDLLQKAIYYLYSGQAADKFAGLKEWGALHGFDMEAILTSIENEKNPDLYGDQLSWLIYTAIHLRKSDPKIIRSLESRYNLLKQIFECRQPELRYNLSYLWENLIKDSLFEARLHELQHSIKDHRLLANLFLFALEREGVDPKSFNKFNEILKRSDYTDKIKLNFILEALDQLQREESLDSRTKGAVLEELFKDPKAVHIQASLLKAVLECGAASRLGKSESFQIILESVFKATVLLDPVEDFAQKWELNIMGRFRKIPLLMIYAAKLASLKDKEELLKAYADFLGGVLEGDFKERRYRTDNNPHLKKISTKMDLEAWKVNSEVLLSGTSKLEDNFTTIDFKKILQDKILSDKHLDPEKVLFLKRVLEGEEAHKINCELGQALKTAEDKTLLRLQSYLIKLVQGQDPQKTLESVRQIIGKMSGIDDFKHDMEGLAKSLVQLKRPSEDVFTLVNTDDPCDLFLCGSEVEGSCQRIEGDPKYNKCLLGYCLNGANRLIAIKNKEGKIVARTILKLLWDERAETPVLFQERVYPSLPKPEHEKALIQAAKDTALRLNLPLTSLTGESDYPHPISGLGSPVPYDYTDAGGGVKPRGYYEIGRVKIVPLA